MYNKKVAIKFSGTKFALESEDALKDVGLFCVILFLKPSKSVVLA
jgi:hypothetical protein